MHAQMIDPDYSIISSENTTTQSLQTIWPEFVLVMDLDGNGVKDDWELPLAQKFCPTLYLHSGDQGVRPVPVESMDRNGDGALGWEDVLISIYSIGGTYEGDYGLGQIEIGAPGESYLMNVKYPKICSANNEQSRVDFNNNLIIGDGSEYWNVWLKVPHFEWGQDSETTPGSWYNSWDSLIQAHQSETAYIDGTTYAHLFTSLSGETVIQYWFFYPFNAAANRHEGDWEHINVVLNSQNPSTANITRVEYYLHEKVTPRYTPGTDYYLVDGTHPKVFVGGYVEFGGYDGNGTHGSYPHADDWDLGGVIGIENVDGLGLAINFANYQNIVILPNISVVDAGDPLDWMLYGSYWGHPLSNPSAGDGLIGPILTITNSILPFIPYGQPWLTIVINFGIWDAYATAGYDLKQDTRLAPLGPTFRKNLWNKVYNQTGLTIF